MPVTETAKNIAISRFNAENDLPTDNAIAKEITDGKFDLVLTASTLSMQAVAKCLRRVFTNRSGLPDIRV
jgi:ABC-type uncharacterized transport system substrate-binding protein